MATYIFDFDGTLADSFTIAFDILVTNAAALRCKQLQPNDRDKIRQMHAKEMLSYLQIPFWRVPRFARKLRKLSKEKITEVGIFPAWESVLRQLKSERHHLGILSSNAQDNIQIVLKRHGLYELFDFIITEKALFGKTRRLHQLMKKFNFIDSETFYIGDEVRDIEAAQANNIKAIAVSWGLNSLQRLEAAAPDLIIHDPRELLR